MTFSSRLFLLACLLLLDNLPQAYFKNDTMVKTGPLKDVYKELRTQHDALLKQHDSLEADYVAQLNKRAEMEAEYKAQMKRHAELEAEYKAHPKKSADLVAEYEAQLKIRAKLLAEYRALIKSRAELEVDYKALLERSGNVEANFKSLLNMRVEVTPELEAQLIVAVNILASCIAQLQSRAKRQAECEAQLEKRADLLKGRRGKEYVKTTYEIKTLRKSLTIYSDPSILLQDLENVQPQNGYSAWDSAVVLADYLERSCASWIKGKKILNFSSGTGYVGIVAACLGGDVTVTDMPPMIPLLQKNVETNSEQLEGTGGRISTKSLNSNDKDNIKALPKQDIILLSNVVFYKESIEAVVLTVVALSGKGTTIIVSQEKWKIGIVWNSFFTLASKYFKLSLIITPHYNVTLWRGNFR